MKPKVFGVGMYKTGTTSLGAALTKLGYRSDSSNWAIIKEAWNPGKEDYEVFLPEIFERAESYDALSDAPWIYVYKELDSRFEGSKFILTTRNYEEVARSDINMWRNERVPESEIPNKQRFIDRIDLHERRVREHFRDREEDLLIIDFAQGEGWEKLCGFLGEEIPNEPFPHSHKGVYADKLV